MSDEERAEHYAREQVRLLASIGAAKAPIGHPAWFTLAAEIEQAFGAALKRGREAQDRRPSDRRPSEVARHGAKAYAEDRVTALRGPEGMGSIADLISWYRLADVLEAAGFIGYHAGLMQDSCSAAARHKG